MTSIASGDGAKTAADPAPTGAQEAAAFDDVMLAMDIVDTLRHRALIVERELASEDREAALLVRLKEIYAAQGIDVPEHILRDGVKALEEKRFVYEPVERGLQHRLARIYIARDRWMKPIALVVGVAAFMTGIYEFSVAAPAERSRAATEVSLSVTLPRALAEARDAALAAAETDNARTRIETVYQDGLAATRAGDAKAAEAEVTALKSIADDLARTLTIRVVSRPGEYSGVFRIPDDAPGARNYYLIVEAVDARGQTHALEIESEEDRRRARVKAWGVRVPEGEFNRIAADKQDDQIIQNAKIGEKPKGRLEPVYSVPGAGGAILEW